MPENAHPNRMKIQAARLSKKASVVIMQASGLRKKATIMIMQASRLSKNPSDDPMQASRLRKNPPDDPMQASALRKNPSGHPMQASRLRKNPSDHRIQAPKLRNMAPLQRSTTKANVGCGVKNRDWQIVMLQAVFFSVLQRVSLVNHPSECDGSATAFGAVAVQVDRCVG